VLHDQTKFLHGAHTGGGDGPGGTGGHSSTGNSDLNQVLGGQLTNDLTNMGDLGNVLKHGHDASGRGFQTMEEVFGSGGAFANPDNKGQPDLKNHTLNHILSDK
jgi:hypothetical protein